jgi:hypothetical protein
MSNPERRAPSDRRTAVRGGRRPDDQVGSAPLILVVGNGRDPQYESEAILAALRFAVAPAVNVDEALRVLDTLQPDLIVARPEEASRLRAESSLKIPIVEYNGPEASDGSLVERVRQAIRKRR